jgi:hypothetical protein
MNGGQSQMMSMSMSSLCLVSVVAAGGVLLWMNGNKPKTTQPPEPMTSGPVGTSAPDGLASGMYNIKYGGVGMSVLPQTCGSTDVGFNNTEENDQQVWNLKPVQGRAGVYYVASEHKQFDSGCPTKYLTAPESCSGTPILNDPKYADRQYWNLVPSGDGKYMLRNMSCADKRQASYLSSSGTTGGFAKAQMTSREGSAYSINPWTSA